MNRPTNGKHLTLDDMCQLWGEVLQLTSVEPHDDFFEIGGDSLQALELLELLEERLCSGDLDLVHLFENPTPRALLSAVGALSQKFDTRRAAEDLESAFFGDAAGDMVVVSDSSAAHHWATSVGLPFRHVSQALDSIPARCMLVGSTAFWYSQLAYLHQALSPAAVLWLPLAAFDGADLAVEYSLEMLLRVDWDEVADGRAGAEERMRERRFRLPDSVGNELHIVVPEGVRIATCPIEPIGHGEFRSLLQSLEVETEYIERESGDVGAEGTIKVDSMLYALGPGTAMTPSESELATRLCRLVGTSARAELTAARGRLTQFTIDGNDHIQDLITLAGPNHGPRITEFSIGLNRDRQPKRWEVNSPLNEGAEGIHVGLGDGYTGVHLDFVAAGVSSSAT